tara:strand:- start:321 stop:1100 length:780 start_codon:yes stop_codon:yes gene_type:complete
MSSLPEIMIAPNGARRNKTDHPQLPLTVEEIVSTANECWQAGAGGIHVHVRDENGLHTLNKGLYREVINELKVQTPGMFTQITTESVGQYSAIEQRQVVIDIGPSATSISIAEMFSDRDRNAVLDFYNWCHHSGILVQHIIYSVQDIRILEDLLESSPHLKNDSLQILFVLGRYSHNLESKPADLDVFHEWLLIQTFKPDWAVCAFGKNETNCLVAAYKQGGKIRVGFENSLWNSNGEIALSNADRVNDVKNTIDKLSL